MTRREALQAIICNEKEERGWRIYCGWCLEALEAREEGRRYLEQQAPTPEMPIDIRFRSVDRWDA